MVGTCRMVNGYGWLKILHNLCEYVYIHKYWGNNKLADLNRSGLSVTN